VLKPAKARGESEMAISSARARVAQRPREWEGILGQVCVCSLGRRALTGGLVPPWLSGALGSQQRDLRFRDPSQEQSTATVAVCRKKLRAEGVPILELTLGIMEKPASVFWVILESSGKGAQKAFLFLHTRRSVMQGVPLCGA